MTPRRLFLLALFASICWAPIANAAKLEGEYRYQALILEADAGTIVNVSTRQERLVFDDDNRFNADGATYGYHGDPDGVVALGGFLEGFGSFDARIGAGEAPLIALSPARGGSGFAFLIAVRSSDAASPPNLTGAYQAALLSFPASGALTPTFSHAPFDTAQTGLTIRPDGAATLDLLSSTALPARSFEVLISPDGSWVVGAPSTQPGLFIAARRDQATPSSFQWLTELSVDAAGPAAATGGLAFSGPARARVFERWIGPRGQTDFRGETAVGFQPDGTGSLGSTPVIAAGGGLHGGVSGIGAGLVLIAIPAPELSDDDVFANPHGAVSAASLSPLDDPAAPRQLRSLFGAGLADATAAAEALPLPTVLEGSSVFVADVATPLLFVSPSQMNYQIPPDASGTLLQVVVRNGQQESDEIFTRLAATSPAVFTVDGSGGGAGIFTHADFTLVSDQSPARPGEIVIAFLTGLGVNQPPPRAWVGGVAAEVLFAGPAPGFAGLDQMNVRIPAAAPLGAAVAFTIATRDGWSDTVTVAVSR